MSTTTPRTDAAIRSVHKGYGGSDNCERYISIGFARELELELIALREEYNNSQHAYMADNSKLVAENNQLKIDISLIREQHNQEMMEFKSDEALIAENKKLIEVARAAKRFLEADDSTDWKEVRRMKEALKSLEESGLKI